MADLSRVRRAYTISDAESFQTSRELLRQSGIFAGSSSGTLVAAALRYCREQTFPKRVVTFICDSGNKYLSKFFNDGWLRDQGFSARPRTGTVGDLIARRYQDGELATVRPSDSLRTALERMRSAAIYQIPVTEDGRLIGVLDDSDIVVALREGSADFGCPVSKAMTSRPKTLPPNAPLSAVLPILNRGLVGLVTDHGRFQGLITRADLLNYLYRQTNGQAGTPVSYQPSAAETAQVGDDAGCRTVKSIQGTAREEEP